MWLIRNEEETNEDYGKRPEERTIEERIRNSILIVDKHSGPTSHQITDWVKKIFNLKKAGHAGTLDPKVTGVLPIALENATKLMPALMGLDKEYVGIMRLHKDVELDFLRKFIAENFVGRIKQIPPRKSAVARRVREKTVYFFDVLEKEDKNVLFHTKVEAGTYIRKLCHDIGEKLGIGAHMVELRRIKFGPFDEEQAHPLVEIKDAYDLWKEEGEEKYLKEILINVEDAIPHIKKIFVKDSAIYALTNGAPLYVGGIVRIQKGIVPGELVAIFSLKNELIALGIAKMDSEKMFSSKRGVAVRIDRVIMPKGTYPKLY